jgi:hypothetical protein
MTSDSQQSEGDRRLDQSSRHSSYAEAELLHLASETEVLTLKTIQQKVLESKQNHADSDYWNDHDYLTKQTILQPDHQTKIATIPLLPPSNAPKFSPQPSYLQMFQNKLKQQEQHLRELTQKIHQEQHLQAELNQLLINQKQAEITNQKLENFVRKLEQEKTQLQKHLQQTKNQIKIGFIGLTVIILAFLLFWFDSNAKNRTIEQQLIRLELEQELNNHSDSETETLAQNERIKQLEENQEKLVQEQTIFRSILQLSGWQNQQLNNLTSETKQGEIFQANAKYEALINKIKKDAPLPTILYYPKSIEPKETVKKSLQSLGFPLAILSPKVTTIPTNYLLYSADIPVEKIKLVAYSLIRTGVEIKYIGKLKLNPNQSLLIEIGADQKFENNPTLTIEKIDLTLSAIPTD